MRHSLRSSLLLLLSSPLSALATLPPSTIFTLPPPLLPGSWFENIAVRPNGKILATRGDAPEIWQIDPATGQGSLLISVAGAFNLTGIAPVTPLSPPPRPRHHNRPGTRDGPSAVPSPASVETYIFASSHIPAPLQVTPGSAKVWTLRIPLTTAPATATLLAALPAAGFLNGITPWTAGRVLISDTEAEAIYLMDVSTGTYTTPLTGLVGVNGIRAVRAATGTGGYVYRADHASLTLSRIPVDAAAVATGPAEVLVQQQLIDDFAVMQGGDGAGKAYLGGMYTNEVVEIVFGAFGTGVGTRRVVATDLTGTGTGLVTVAAFGRRNSDAGFLYAAAGQGGGNAAIVRVDPGV
ncbi:hypothetical protein C8A05DRAFT_38445 [Staphylotrichum tortipilum]|uniref:Uncharacterized protein n=1 Tax=Staphylotrichum tortipilum TaxID=2831512 RepID=A0AAN6RPA1_9PEZI|nr:hypothetical protein C8A05DRAFT_38445 [Staphylotrichum longicolle]